MTAIKMWIAVHPTDPTNYLAVFEEPREDGHYLPDDDKGENYTKAPWVEYVCLPLQLLGESCQ